MNLVGQHLGSLSSHQISGIDGRESDDQATCDIGQLRLIRLFQVALEKAI